MLHTLLSGYIGQHGPEKNMLLCCSGDWFLKVSVAECVVVKHDIAVLFA